MRKNILGAVAVVAMLASAGGGIGFLLPISSDSRADFCEALAGGGRWMKGQCLRSNEINEMIKQVELFCQGNADYQHCLTSQKEALVRIVRTSEEHPLEMNQASPECMASSRNALGRTNFVKASSCLDAKTRAE
jgi:hypothetical protein